MRKIVGCGFLILMFSCMLFALVGVGVAWAFAPRPGDIVQNVAIWMGERVIAAGSWLSGRPVSQEAKVPTDAAITATSDGCPQARDLGPWAPDVHGVGETFEITANENVSAGVHVQLWWPAGSGQKWDKKEISVFVPSGLSVEVQNGAGRGWEYSLSCSQDEIQAQIKADSDRRKTDTAFYGTVDIDALIKAKLVEVRFDRRADKP